MYAKFDNSLAWNQRLILVSAPAGYGKTLVTSQWVHLIQQQDNGHRIFWLSLDDRDNDLRRFFAYLVSALQLDPSQNHPGLPIHDMLSIPQLPSAEFLMTTLINSLEHQWPSNSLKTPDLPPVTGSCILVLDDYQKIREPQIHEAIQFLLNHLPLRMHLILVTREDPPLALPRMRIRNELTEIRAQDLRFTLSEATAFLTEFMGLDLKPQWIQTLVTRTEGWIAGLQLAALSLPNHDCVESFLREFRGTHRYLVDYLMDEVLKLQPAHRKDFLCKTALLEQFNASLCFALTGREDSQDLLNEIEQSNLFLVPLDGRRDWYRYHHLFSDCLRTHLPREEQNRLLMVASQWFEAEGFPFEAVEYALSSGDFPRAADTLERVLEIPRTWSGGQISRLEGWLKALPQTCLQERPNLQIRVSRALFLSGLIQQSTVLLDQAQQTLESRPHQEGLHRALFEISTYRAAIAAMEGQMSVARTLMGGIHEAFPRQDTLIQARANDTLGLILEGTGDLDGAHFAYLQASALALQAGVDYLAINALCEAAMVQIIQGLLPQAQQSCQQALEIAGTAHSDLAPAGLVWAVLGEIHRNRGELALAEQSLLKGIALSQSGGIIDDLRHSYRFLTLLRLSQKNCSQSVEALKQSLMVMQTYRSDRLDHLAGALEARVLLARGKLTAAAHWADRFELLSPLGSAEYLQDFETLTLARIFLAKQQDQKVQFLLKEIMASSSGGARPGTLLEATILLARFHWIRGSADTARKLMNDALHLAQQQGSIILFLDEGEEIRLLLSACLNHGIESVSLAYGQQLLDAFSRVHSDCPNPLSSQEMRILRLIADGLSNQNIADNLFINVGTVKWHAHNIYGKLDVSSRTQAVSRAQDLHIL